MLGQDVLDPVLPADPIEQHHTGPRTEPPGDHLAVVRQDLRRTPIHAHRPSERIARRGRTMVRDGGSGLVEPVRRLGERVTGSSPRGSTPPPPRSSAPRLQRSRINRCGIPPCARREASVWPPHRWVDLAKCSRLAIGVRSHSLLRAGASSGPRARTRAACPTANRQRKVTGRACADIQSPVTCTHVQ